MKGNFVSVRIKFITIISAYALIKRLRNAAMNTVFTILNFLGTFTQHASTYMTITKCKIKYKFLSVCSPFLKIYVCLLNPAVIYRRSVLYA
jgi:hypothetical protein